MSHPLFKSASLVGTPSMTAVFTPDNRTVSLMFADLRARVDPSQSINSISQDVELMLDVKDKGESKETAIQIDIRGSLSRESGTSSGLVVLRTPKKTYSLELTKEGDFYRKIPLDIQGIERLAFSLFLSVERSCSKTEAFLEVSSIELNLETEPGMQ